MNPLYSLFAISFMLWMGAKQWRRKRLRRAMRDLPTRLQRMLGPEPEYDLPDGDVPEALRAFAAVHRRTAWIQRVATGAALLWLLYILFLFARKQFS
ncbi:hypothetical protein [Tropicibacter sp. S64]|uniref:hypothetical protein n=1 Tax=Tropicibacter sp. S64 TaxID=3415122 RepID=UPI003C7DA790